jgi:hypothetical protein
MYIINYYLNKFMKYKKQIATSALALSLLLVGGSSVFAATLQDLGVKKAQPTYQKQEKKSKDIKVKNTAKSSNTGTVLAINDSGFTLDVKNIKTKTTSSIDVKTDSSTVYTKNGVSAAVSDLATGQKVIVSGTLDKTANTVLAKTVKIIVKTSGVKKVEKVKSN